MNYEIISKFQTPKRIINLFEHIVDKILCKNNYLIELNEVREEKLGDSIINLKLYKVNKEKNLLSSRTRKSLQRMIENNLSSEIYNFRRQYELPLFNYNSNLENEDVENNKDS